MIKNAKFSGYYFDMNLNMWGDFQICISVPLIKTKIKNHFVHYVDNGFYLKNHFYIKSRASKSLPLEIIPLNIDKFRCSGTLITVKSALIRPGIEQIISALKLLLENPSALKIDFNYNSAIEKSHKQLQL